jgi:hypothetical protein
LIPCLNGQVWFLTEILKSVMLVVVNKNDNCITLFSYSEWWRCKDRRDHDNPGNGRCQPERDDRTIRVWNIRSAFIERIFYCISPVAKQGGRHACMQDRTCFSDDNRYEHEAVRSTAGMRIPVSGTRAAQQQSDAKDLCSTCRSSRKAGRGACLHAGPDVL